jgi:hypothetical protein
MGPLSLFLWSRPGPLHPGLDQCSPAAVWRAHMCCLWAPVRLPEAWEPLVQAASSARVRKLAADRQWVEDREAAEDDLSFRPSFRKAAEPGRPMTKERAKL